MELLLTVVVRADVHVLPGVVLHAVAAFHVAELKVGVNVLSPALLFEFLKIRISANQIKFRRRRHLLVLWKSLFWVSFRQTENCFDSNRHKLLPSSYLVLLLNHIHSVIHIVLIQFLYDSFSINCITGLSFEKK